MFDFDGMAAFFKWAPVIIVIVVVLAIVEAVIIAHQAGLV